MPMLRRYPELYMMDGPYKKLANGKIVDSRNEEVSSRRDAAAVGPSDLRGESRCRAPCLTLLPAADQSLSRRIEGPRGARHG